MGLDSSTPITLTLDTTDGQVVRDEALPADATRRNIHIRPVASEFIHEFLVS
jgi:hypothetical protein